MVCDIKFLKDICPIPPLKDGAAKKLSSKLQSDCSIHSKAKVGPSKRPCPSRLYVPFLQVRGQIYHNFNRNFWEFLLNFSIYSTNHVYTIVSETPKRMVPVRCWFSVSSATKSVSKRINFSAYLNNVMPLWVSLNCRKLRSKTLKPNSFSRDVIFEIPQAAWFVI